MYPRISHSFVQREVDGLRRLGVQVETFSVHKVDPAHVLSHADHQDARRTQWLLPMNAWRALWELLFPVMRHPVAVLSTLLYAMRTSPPGLKSAIWQGFYVAEAVLMWKKCQQQAIRHIHAHFANVASDVARLTCVLGNNIDGDAAFGEFRHWTWSFTMHGPTEFSDVRRFALARKVVDAATVVCISNYCRSQLMALVSPEYWDKLRVVHCGVDTSQFGGSTKFDGLVTSGRSAEDRVVGDGPVNILCVGRLVDEKAQRLLVTAVSVLRSGGCNVRLTLVGEGPCRVGLERLVADLCVSDVVRLVGAIGQDDIASYYADADIFCLPSFSEGLPVVLMEAMASGLPVVTTRIAGIPELVADLVSGLVVSPGNVEELSAALRCLVVDDELRVAMGNAGRMAVKADFDTRTTSLELAGVFADLFNP